MTTTQSLAERLEELRRAYEAAVVEMPFHFGKAYAARRALDDALTDNLPTILSALRSRDSDARALADALATCMDVNDYGEWFLPKGSNPDTIAPSLIAALSSHAETAGMVSVPVEPTEAMIEAGWIDKEDVSPAEIYSAMIKAAKGGEI